MDKHIWHKRLYSRKQSEVRVCCRTEGLSYTDLLAEANKSERKNDEKF